MFLRGTLSRVDAISLFGGICKTRKTPCLHRSRLASALHVRQAHLELESSNDVQEQTS